MNFGELRDEFNRLTDNYAAPSLWGADEVDSKINLAYYEACDRGMLIYDRNTFTVNTQPNVSGYPLDKRIQSIKRAFLMSPVSDGSSFVPEVQATGSITFSGTVAGATCTSVKVNSIEIMGSTYTDVSGSLSDFALGVATLINQNPANLLYTASAVAGVVTLTANQGLGATVNGMVVAATVTTISVATANIGSIVAGVTGSNNSQYVEREIFSLTDDEVLEWTRWYRWGPDIMYHPVSFGMLRYGVTEDHEFILVPRADLVRTIKLDVWRLPLVPLAQTADIPEIDTTYHYKMLAWALHLAYLKHDSETYNEKLADKYEADFERDFGPPKNAIQRRAQLQNRTLRVAPSPI
jgi:hypothetical protein